MELLRKLLIFIVANAINVVLAYLYVFATHTTEMDYLLVAISAALLNIGFVGALVFYFIEKRSFPYIWAGFVTLAGLILSFLHYVYLILWLCQITAIVISLFAVDGPFKKKIKTICQRTGDKKDY